MTQTIKAIQTSYKGYRFRSRLEARWAVFFDAIYAEWEYEKEGFDVGGTWYLPDFWLPHDPMDDVGVSFWIEIKPTPLDTQQIQLLTSFARMTGHGTYAICGQPWPGEHQVYWFSPRCFPESEALPVPCGHLIESHHEWDGEKINVYVDYAREQMEIPFLAGVEFWRQEDGALDRAFRAARGARFEHGEIPRMETTTQ